MAKSGPRRAGKRREELRRNLPKPAARLRTLLQRPEVVNAALVLLLFAVATASIVVWSRNQVRVAIDRIMFDTRLNRVDYEIEDREATIAKREEARAQSPRIYRLNETYLEELTRALNGLPKAVEGKTKLEEISPQIVEEYRLTEPGLVALQPYAVEGETTVQWQGWVTRLISRGLRRNPLLTSEEYQMYSRTLNRALLLPGERTERLGEDTTVMELTGNLSDRYDQLVRNAGFPASVRPFVLARLGWQPKPTFVFDERATEDAASVAAALVPPEMDRHAAGDVLYGQGQRIDASAYDQIHTEAKAFATRAPTAAIWLPRLGVLGLVMLLTAFTGMVLLTYPRVLRNTVRVLAICALMLTMLAITVVLSSHLPKILHAAAVAPTLFVTVVVMLSYDRRLALFVSAVQCALVALALQQGVGWFVVLITTCGTMIATLGDVRSRNSLINAGVLSAVVAGGGILVLGLFAAPPIRGVWLQVIGDATWAAVAGLAVGFIMLGILPGIERLFDITTGMTLAELRDPSQPLLRQLQQRAPGTYNHSLQVANIAEAAADAIRADGLLVFVGALYHDIGKMNKPEYFVENQSGGVNKHSKLRPAMSLLVIIGHVKDGIELAREYGLPRSLQHFIEAHHGTTLVEYFYHAALEQAEADEKASVNEIEFRYPGPKPQTREAAVLMLADAVESAARAMAEPNPSRIESLVRDLSRKRLLDGQFDECDLTFRELGLIEDAMIARLCAIHHGRIAYPTARSEDVAPEAAAAS